VCSVSPPESLSLGNQIFNKAKKGFLASLSSDEQAQFARCSTAKELLDYVQGMDVISKSKRRGMPLLKTIKGFSDRLCPYFKTIERFCSSNPEWSCIAWGALRLILQAGILLPSDLDIVLTSDA
jgi:hypothetical protein